MPAGAAGNVAIVVYDGVGMFELGVACDVFGTNDLADLGLPWYRLFICGAGGAPVTADGGLRIHPPFGLERTRRVETVVVPPTDRLDEVPTEVFDALRRAHARGCRIVSLCTGAFVLAEAGLLEGRRATTHWTECDDLARTYTDVRVDPGVLYVDEGDILTSAGSAASIDLCLHVVRCDYGSEIATQLARQLVVPPQRDGGQAQYIDAPLPTLDSSSLFADTIAWVQGHLDEPLTVVRPGRPVRHEPENLCPPIRRRDRNHAPPMAAAPARPSGPAAPRDHRPLRRVCRGGQWLLHGGKSPQALQPDHAHQPAGLPAHLCAPGRLTRAARGFLRSPELTALPGDRLEVVEEILLVEVSGRVATVTLNRPAVRNALNAALRRALPTTMESLDRDESVDVIILTGADPAFCAGIDLKELGGNEPRRRGGDTRLDRRREAVRPRLQARSSAPSTESPSPAALSWRSTATSSSLRIGRALRTRTPASESSRGGD